VDDKIFLFCTELESTNHLFFFLAGTIISDIIEIKVFSRTCIACVVLRQKGIYVQEERHRPRATGDTKA
jgi:hypothetical protein